MTKQPKLYRHFYYQEFPNKSLNNIRIWIIGADTANTADFKMKLKKESMGENEETQWVCLGQAYLIEDKDIEILDINDDATDKSDIPMKIIELLSTGL